MCGPERLLTIREVSEWTRLSVRTLYVLCETNRIPVKRVAHRLRFDRSEVSEWIQQEAEHGKQRRT